MRYLCLVVVAAIMVLPAAGCDKRVHWGQVSGVITQEGKPVEPALVLFSNREQGIEMTAETDAEGRFTLRTDKIDGLPVGTYRVVVTPRAVNLPPPEQGMMFKGPPPALQSHIPTKYGDVATTPLTATVAETPNEFTFDLQP